VKSTDILLAVLVALLAGAAVYALLHFAQAMIMIANLPR
jgi:hypothetical protein